MSAYLEEIFGLSGRAAVVTGGSSGIGRAMAVALGRAGARIILVARSEKPLAETVAELTGHGGRGGPISAAPPAGAAVAPPTDTILSRYGPPEVPVTAAAGTRRPPMPALTEDDWNVTLAANL